MRLFTIISAPVKIALVVIFIISVTPTLAHPPAPDDVRTELSNPEAADRRAFLKSIEKTRSHKTLTRREDRKVRRALLKAAGVEQARINAILLGVGSASGHPAFPTGGTPPFPTRGVARLPVILIDFKDQVAATEHPLLTRVEIENRIFGDGNATAFPYDSLHDYYHRASNGQLDLQGDVLGWVRFPENRREYAPKYGIADDEQIKEGKRQKALYKLITDAMTALDQATDFSTFDNNNDGEIDAIIVLYAGKPDGWGDFFWAYQWSFWHPETTGPSAKKFDGKNIGTFVFQNVADKDTNLFSMQTLIHEFGHLVGIRDYYDYCPKSRFEELNTETNQPMKCGRPNLMGPGPDGGIGGFDMMHANRANHNAYSRWLLDWIKTPVVVGSGQQTITLAGSGELVDTTSMAQAVAIFPDLSRQLDQSAPSREMFIAEYRSPNGNDAGIIPTGQGGLAIWHVAADITDGPNKTAFDNSYTATKHLTLKRSGNSADYSEKQSLSFSPIELFQKGESFGPATVPSSLAHDGSQTGVIISNIAISGNTATATFGIIPASAPTPTPASPASPAPPGNPANTPDITDEDLQRYKDVDFDALVEAENRYEQYSKDQLADALEMIQTELGAEASLQSVLLTQIMIAKLAERDAITAIETAPLFVEIVPEGFETLPMIAANAAVQKNTAAIVQLVGMPDINPSTRLVAANALAAQDDRFTAYAGLSLKLDRIARAITRTQSGTGATDGRLSALRRRESGLQIQLAEELEKIMGASIEWAAEPR